MPETLDIRGLPLLSDNYAWLWIRPASRECAVVDPSEAAPVAAAIRAQGLTLRWILATHHHWDHTGGIAELAAELGPVEVVGSSYDRDQGRVPAQTRAVDDGDTLDVLGTPVACLHVPGHTLGAVAYHLPREGAVFTGDTLFTAGCGRLFEGTPAQMVESLTRLRALPPATRVYCGHEYTVKNLRFAVTLLPGDDTIAERLAASERTRAAGEATVPASLAVEQRTNPFLRADDPALAKATGRGDPVDVFAEIRRRRDAF